MNVSLRAAVEAFAAYEFDQLERGITDEEAAEGLRRTFKGLGITWDEDCLFYCGELDTIEAVEARAVADAKRDAERAAWRLANPEEAAQQDRISAMLDASMRATTDMLSRSLLDSVFAPNAMLANLVKPSPNAAAYTTTDDAPPTS